MMIADAARSGLDAKDAKKMQLSVEPHKGKAAYRIPYFDLGGKPTGFCRWRYLEKVLDAKGKVQRYAQPGGTLPKIYYPPNADWEQVHAAGSDIAVTEGEKKSYAACKAGVPCIALGGVWSFMSKKKGIQLLSDFETLKGHRLIICFDSEAVKKFRRAEKTLITQLHALGIRVAIARIPPGKDGKNVGIDDYIVGHGAAAFKKIIASAADVAAVAALTTASAAFTFNTPALVIADARDGTETTRQLSELGNAHRMVDRCGARMRYVPGMGWLLFYGGAWHWSYDGAAVRAEIAKLPAFIYEEGVGCTDTEALHYARWSRLSQKNNTIKATETILSDQRELRVSYGEVDVDTMLVGLDGARQVIDLRTGKVRPVVQNDYITKSLRPVRLGDAAKAVRWLQFLDEIFEGNAQLVDWLQRWCGYLLTGNTSEHIFLFFYGTGRNGKSTFAKTLKYIMHDYGRVVPIETLTDTKRRAGASSSDLMVLVGCRFALSNETEKGRALAESLIKTLTSEDPISARALYKEHVDFYPTHKLLIFGNHKPIIHGTDDAIWARVCLVPFTKKFEGKKKDLKLAAKLESEAPDILAWMVAGCLKWQHSSTGLGHIPKVVVEQTQEYRDDQDVLKQWLNEKTIKKSSGCVLVGALYSNYSAWAGHNGYRPVSAKTLGLRLQDLGYPAITGAGHARMRSGLELNTSTGAARGGEKY